MGNSAELARLFADAWEVELVEDPLFATQYGDHRFDDRLPSVALADQDRRRDSARAFLDRLLAIDLSALTVREKVSYEIFRRLMADRLADYEFLGHLVPITNREGFHVEFPDLPGRLTLDSAEDYRNYTARLRNFLRYTREHIELMRQGIEKRITLPAVVLRDCEGPLEAQIVEDPKQSLLFKPFLEFPDSVPEADRAALADAGAEAIAQGVVPAYREFLAFMVDEYVPAARDTVGAFGLPRGREYYRHRVQHFTTLDISPQEVHDTGLAEVARIQAEMQEVIQRTGFEGDFAAFVEHLRTDPRFYAETPEQLLKEVSYVLKRMDGELPKLFASLPRSPYGIREVPAYIAPHTTTAYYMQPSADGSRAGYYYVNVYDLKSRPLYEIEALSLHEAVPGHHLQIAIAQELTDVPEFQRFYGATSFVEGWALYAERLGLETGFYQDAYSDFGRLSYEMWRACRLVVDTGMHDLGWSREQAIEYMAAHTALARHNVTTEVDRYIAWPGQALAYKMGELTIRRLRREAEERLGEKFDVREFHDVVLRNGAVPLAVLEELVRAWVEAKDEG